MELMVGIGVGMLGILVAMQVFSIAEEQRRSTQAGAATQSDGLIAMYTIERDVRMAGLGVSQLPCTTITTYDADRTPEIMDLSAFPVQLTSTAQNSPSQVIQVVYGTSSYSTTSAVVQAPHTSQGEDLFVNTGLEFRENDLLLLSQGGVTTCNLVQLTADAEATGTANTTGPGTQWRLSRDAGTSSLNPPAATAGFYPGGAYNVGARVTNIGNLTSRRYFVENNMLMMQDGTANPISIANNIFALVAVYGRDTNGDRVVDEWGNTGPTSANDVVALRIGIVARVSQLEKVQVSPAQLQLWTDGPTIALTAPNDRNFRYQIYQTTVPLRNVLWR